MMSDALRRVLDALPSPHAVVEADGTLVAVNEAWSRSAAERGPTAAAVRERVPIIACLAAPARDPDLPARIARGIREVADGACEQFVVEYDDHVAGEPRRSSLRATRLVWDGLARVLLAHEDVTERRQAEEALRGSERRFRSLIENSADIIAIVDAEGVIRYESPSAVRVLGREAASWRERSFFDLAHSGDLPELFAAFTRCLTQPGTNVPIVFRAVHPVQRDSEWHIVEGTLRNLLDDDAVGGIVVNAREVTQRRRAEEAQARLTAVMDATPDFVCTTDPHGRLSYLNRAGRRILGLTADADISRRTLGDIHPRWVTDVLLDEGIPTAMRDGVWTGETALLDHSGEEIPVLQVLLSHKGPGGAVEFFSTTARDITERKRAEDALRQSHQILRQIAENIAETLWIYDLEQERPVYVSPGYERMWGRPVATAYEDPGWLLDCLASAQQGPPGVAPDAHLAGGQSEGEFMIQGPIGSARWLRGRWFPIHDADGATTRLVGLMEDVTERKRIEVDLRRVQRLEAIGHLAAGMAHEINTPIQYAGDNVRFLQESFAVLAQLVGRYEGLLHERASDASLRESLDALSRDEDVAYVLEEAPRAIVQALEGVERVTEIVRAMREFSHPGASQKCLTDLNQAIRNTLTVSRHEWRYVAELITDLDPDLPPVPCLPGDVNQAILNILVNATQAITERAAAEGRDPQAALGSIHISTARVGEWAEIRVRDDGAGIPEDVRPRIFDPFFTTREVGRGAGQGLTLVHAVIVERHGGQIAFETEVGAGTTFVLRLPIGDDSRDHGDRQE